MDGAFLIDVFFIAPITTLSGIRVVKKTERILLNSSHSFIAKYELTLGKKLYIANG